MIGQHASFSRTDTLLPFPRLFRYGMTPLLWGLEEREKLLEFYERVSGSRFHAAYFRPGGVHQDLPAGLLEDIAEFCEHCPRVIDDIEVLLTDNRIFRQRPVDIGVVRTSEERRVGTEGDRTGRSRWSPSH